MNLLDRLLVLPQYLAPQHALSRAVRWATRQPWSTRLIPPFCRQFEVDLSEAARPLEDYLSFNDFFTRKLKDGARPLDKGQDLLASPADGAVSQLGSVVDTQLLQAKGHTFALAALLGGLDGDAGALLEGRFITIYLSPRDYHRVHAPCDFLVQELRFIPGDLFSVNDRTARTVPYLYARNERLVLLGTSPWGPAAMVLVGAMLVGSMSMEGFELEPLAEAATRMEKRPLAPALDYAQGAEVGRFNMGSTVILVLPPGSPEWPGELVAGTKVRMGERLAGR